MSSGSESSPLRLIKAGSGGPPIFIAHGLCGTVQVSELARHIQTENPIYGIQAKGLDGKDEPFDRVEDMAEFYLAEIEKLHPRGPYLLIGYSFGGLVALEVAQRLVKSGKHVALLVLLDSFPHPHFMPLPWRLRLFAMRMKTHAGNIRKLSIKDALFYVASGRKRRLRHARELDDSKTKNSHFKQADLWRVNDRAYLAYERYRPRFYPGKINFATAADTTFFPADPAVIWSDLSADLEIEVIPGDHLTIVTSEFRALASLLTRHIQRHVSATRSSSSEHSPKEKGLTFSALTFK
jgi:thioesterase domain-containing protein